MGEEEIKGSTRRGEFKKDILIHCKNLCKCCNVLPPSTEIKEKKTNERKKKKTKTIGKFL
jgi:hypothetical protein